ncbi:hypothetical protein RAJCM14343_0152 [Rhodococcus aetherivorans]|uniref:Uncharacterized protein n=1 Tax=Rhodococcus aetherivorans TaxID=191292 RepID=A0ABQ0YEF7_9NOCA|nr:hypothetical protein RAJCM14343_0152 [Rhodococcus aetherivorans]CCW10164.1 hypothetical protein EBESD8_6920 [Rhodococcus aetherivorans]
MRDDQRQGLRTHRYSLVESVQRGHRRRPKPGKGNEKVNGR